jgi:hypothetical protein
MAKRVLLIVSLALVGCGAGAGVPGSEAAGKGVGTMAAPEGVTVSGSPYRYATLSPNTVPKVTVIERIDRDGGRVGRWWYLRGHYYVPAVAYDGNGGGLSTNGRTLVLSRFSFAYPPRETRLVVLDTDLYLRHPRRPGQQRPPHAITRIDLKGDFSFDAISPDGSIVYLIHRYLSPRAGAAYVATYEVRALDTASGRLLPEPIVDPTEPDEKMQGLPITRASSPDGRWAYTLYDGNGKEPFLHALDTVRGRAVCVDLPQLEGRHDLFMSRLRMEGGGRRLAVLSRPADLDRSRQLLSVDTKTFAVREVTPVATASSDASSPWLPIAIVAAALAAAMTWLLARRQRAAARRPLEQR